MSFNGKAIKGGAGRSVTSSPLEKAGEPLLKVIVLLPTIHLEQEKYAWA
jgi:hypothetical protein